MLWPLDMFKKGSDIIIGVAGDRSAQIACVYVEGSDPLGARALCQRSTQMIVDDRFKRPSCPARLRLQARGHILFERKGRSHIVMLSIRHHDVQRLWACIRLMSKPLFSILPCRILSTFAAHRRQGSRPQRSS